MAHGLSARDRLAIYVARHMASRWRRVRFAMDGRYTLEDIMSTRRDGLQALRRDAKTES